MSKYFTPGSDDGAAPTAGAGEARQSLQMWIDFVCPYCFLAEKPLAEATRGLNVEIDWMPFELRPYPQPTLRPEDEYLQTVWPRSVYPLAARLGVDIRLPDVSPQPYSRLALEGLQFAKEHGRATQYVETLLRGFFQRSLDIGDPVVLEALAGEAGLAVDAFRAALREGWYRERHKQALELARRLGIRAVPTLVFAGHRLEGVPDGPALRRALQEQAGRKAP
jgi:predicted DsbA family dithiol-disulfide isomerase